MKLKTLRDIIGIWKVSQGEDSPDIALQKMLKQEAIKDIKKIKDFPDLDFEERFQIRKLFFQGLKPDQYDRNIIINYIKWKFSITEEDLK